MSSDSETGPSPLPSPIFARCSPARGTVARRCREFYLKRLERTANMQKRWSICDVPQDPCSFQGDRLTVASSLQDVNRNLNESECEDRTNVSNNEQGTLVPIETKLDETSRNNSVTDVLTNGNNRTSNNDVEFSKEDNTSTSHSTPKIDDAAKMSSKFSDYNNTFDGYPLRKCRSSFDIAMDSLRKEISSLIAQDNDLFRQLLSLHDSIAELRERQRHSAYIDDDDDDIEYTEEDEDECRRRSQSPSLESLSDPGELPETSPESTLSSRSSLSSHRCSNRYRKRETAKQRNRGAQKRDSRPLVFIDKSEVCFRCRKMAPPYRRASSITSLYYLHEDMESYDSGIHLQGSHSDSDHEIFV
ncbi:uncharacterized protein LOC129216178 [Uloborus diversus]|uniref:uncharacterized protein LOC129216178 n=1 Tax=Uloborus diversus TaxID=327109 RepID=UPI0024095842|nr:uncharacterized protein LOC129216178 [Uloborus diversus]